MMMLLLLLVILLVMRLEYHQLCYYRTLPAYASYRT